MECGWKAQEKVDLIEGIEKRKSRLCSKLSPKTAREAAELLEEYAEHKCTLFAPHRYCQLLGTGAAIPSKYRNVSSTLVRIHRDFGEYDVTIDCLHIRNSNLQLFSLIAVRELPDS